MTAPAGVFAAAGLPASSDPALSLLTLIRILYDTPQPADDWAFLAQVTGARGSGGEMELPLPLPAALFEGLLGTAARGPGDFFRALVSDRRAALLYSGLMAMDGPTRGFIASRPDLVHELADRAGLVAAFGRSVRVSNGRVAVPGGDAAAPLWEDVVGARVDEPTRFIPRLLSSSGAAYMLDTLTHLPAPQQRFALGLWIVNEAHRRERLGALVDVFAGTGREWSPAEFPFTRPPHDPALLLRLVPADAAGAPPAWFRRPFWEAALTSTDLPRDPRRSFRAAGRGPLADAAWIGHLIADQPTHVRAARFPAFAFGVRRNSPVDGAAAADLVFTVRAFARYPALMLAIERMGIDDPAVYVAAAGTARVLEEVSDVARAHTALAQFQASLAIVGRAARAGRVTAGAAAQLVTSLCAVPLEEGRYGARIAEWLERTLIPALGDAGRKAASLEAALLAAMADRSPDADGRAFEWEGMRYLVDYTAGDVARFEMVRARQGGERVDEALVRMRGAGESARDKDAAERALATALTGVVYAPHQGDPLELFDAAARMFERHDFGSRRAGVSADARRRLPWARPRVLSTVGEQMRVTGALVGLDLGLSRFAARRLVTDHMPAPPRLNRNDRETFLDTAALVNPRRLSDRQMQEIAGALARGRLRVAGAADEAALDALAAGAGVSAVRRQLLSWMRRDGAASGDAVLMFSLVELLRAGGGDTATLDALGVSEEALTGGWRQSFPDLSPWENVAGRPGAGHVSSRVPDLALRVAELLAEIGAPSALMPGVFSYATLDFVDEAPSMHTDDWNALVHQARALERERVEDYIAAVAARGPLRPVPR